MLIPVPLKLSLKLLNLFSLDESNSVLIFVGEEAGILS